MSYQKKLVQGFTLIELLVVVAIIGILSTVVLSSLGNARVKSRQSKAQTTFAQLRSLAESSFHDNNSFINACADSAVQAAMTDAAKVFVTTPVFTSATGALPNGVSSYISSTPASTLQTKGSMRCYSKNGTWAAAISFGSATVNKADQMYCVDSTGAATVLVGQTTWPISSADQTC